MTSPLHKKHQTTPQNTRRGGASKFLLGAVSVLSMCLCAFFLVQAIGAEEGPLDRLRNRSAEKRWKTIRERIADRRESRRERVESRKEYPVDSSQEENAKLVQKKKLAKKSQQDQLPATSSSQKKKSQLPAVTPFTADQPIYFEQFQFDKQHARKRSPKHVSGSRKLPKSQKSAAAIELPLPSIHPAPFPASKQVNDFPLVNPLPVSHSKEISKTKNVNTAFAPDVKLPGFKPDVPNLNSATPEEVENELKAQGLGSEYDEIKPIQSISPFVDYEPDKKLRAEDPGRHLCFPEEVRSDLISNANVQCPGIESLPGSEKPLSRNFAHLDYAWKASNIHSYPLYFEDPNLERYGHIHRPLIQPIASLTRFNIQLLGLPYQMAMQPVSKCVYPLGYYRPGDVCAPKYHYQIPLNPWAALAVAEVYTGLFFLIP